MRRKLQTKRGRQRTLCGCKLLELFIKRGFRQFLLRGLEKVNGEWSLICTGHNSSNCSALGSSTGKHGSMGQLMHRNFCRGSEHGAIRKAMGAGRGNRQN